MAEARGRQPLDQGRQPFIIMSMAKKQIYIFRGPQFEFTNIILFQTKMCIVILN